MEPMSKDPLGLVGVVLDPQVRVDAFADEGDLSVLYKGRHLPTDSPVAIRCLNLPTTLDPALAEPLVESFHKESRAHQRLAPSNPNIVQTLASGTTVAPTTGQEIPYVIREWLDGHTLAAHIEQRRSDGASGWALGEVLTLLDPVADALAYLHGQGIAHHAINPSNLFVVNAEPHAVVKIADLGNARATSDKEGGGIRVLLPQYAAPEQVDKQVGVLGTWTDVYSLAVLVLELLVGGLSTRDVAASVLADPKNRPSPKKLGLSLPRGVEETLERALSIEPSRRPADAAAFWKELRAAAATAKRAAPAKRGAPVANPLVKRTLVGLAPTKLPNEVRTPSAAETKPAAAAATREPNRAELPLANAGAPPPTDELEPDLYIPALGRPSLTLRLALAVAWAHESLRAGARGAATLESRARQWLRLRAWPWIVAHAAADRSPRARAALAGVVLGGCILLLLVVRLAVALVVQRPVKTPAAPSEEPPAASAAPSSDTPPATPTPVPPPEESSAIELPEQAPSTPPTLLMAKAFTRAAATAALDAVSSDLLTCPRPSGLSGPGSVRVTFGNEGTVVHIKIGPPYANTQDGACILDRLRGARMAPFRGPPGGISYTFTLAARNLSD
jgi:hypothetical protein